MMQSPWFTLGLTLGIVYSIGLDRFIITYDENMCEFRNLIDHKVITDFKFNNFNPFAMHGDLSISHSDTAIRELAYYPVVTKSNDQLFFLN